MNYILCIVIAFVVLYLLTGIVFFNLAQSQLGGKDEYLKILQTKGFKDPRPIYHVITVGFVLLWPRALIKAVGKKK